MTTDAATTDTPPAPRPLVAIVLELLDLHGPASAGALLELEERSARMSASERYVALRALDEALAELGRLGLVVRVGGRRWKLTRTGRRELELARNLASSPHGERTLDQAVAILADAPQEAAQGRAGGES